MGKYFGTLLLILSNYFFANSDPVIWSGIGYFVDSGKTSSTYPNLTSLEKDLNLARLISDKFSGNENIIIGGSLFTLCNLCVLIEMPSYLCNTFLVTSDI